MYDDPTKPPVFQTQLILFPFLVVLATDTLTIDI